MPKNDDWREVHLAHVESLGQCLWLRCNACGHSITPDPREFASDHHLDMKTPLLTIARRLKCTHCNERKAHCWPEPYGIEMKGLRLDEHIYNDVLDAEERERNALIEAVSRI